VSYTYDIHAPPVVGIAFDDSMPANLKPPLALACQPSGASSMTVGRLGYWLPAGRAEAELASL